MTKVSVIIPVYNVERYLRQCLDTILGQTLKEIEIICVDDGSSDSSPVSARDVADRVFRSFLWSPWNKLLRRAFVEHHRLTYQNLPRCNDIAFNATALALAERILFDKSAYYYYRTDVLGSAAALRDKHPNTHALAWDEVERRLKERGCFEPFADDLRRVRAIGELNTLKLISDPEVFAAHYVCVRNERMPRYGFSADDFREVPEASALRTELEAVEKYDSPLAFLLLRNRHITETLTAERTKRIALQKSLRKTKAQLETELEEKRHQKETLEARLAALQKEHVTRLFKRVKSYLNRIRRR